MILTMLHHSQSGAKALLEIAVANAAMIEKEESTADSSRSRLPRRKERKQEIRSVGTKQISEDELYVCGAVFVSSKLIKAFIQAGKQESIASIGR